VHKTPGPPLKGYIAHKLTSFFLVNRHDLGGLEYSSRDFHLQHPGQVQAVGKLRAIVYYQSGRETGKIMSDFVALERI
jgi:hypothetical protein